MPTNPRGQKKLAYSTQLAKLILEGRYAPKDTVKVDCVNGVMRFDKGSLINYRSP